jgi:hypothetical protein
MGYSVRTNSDQTKHALFSMNSTTRGEMKYVQSITARFRAFALHSCCSNVTTNLPYLNNCGLAYSRAFRLQFEPFRSAESGYTAHTSKYHLFPFFIRSNRLCKHVVVAALRTRGTSFFSRVHRSRILGFIVPTHLMRRLREVAALQTDLTKTVWISEK